jgi:hypothetical protein
VRELRDKVGGLNLIGRNPARLDTRRRLVAHHFVMLNPAASTGLVDEMVDLRPAQYVVPIQRNDRLAL